MADRILDTHPIPNTTSVTVQMPQKIVRCGVRKDRAHEGRQAWLDWMTALKVGESFMVNNYTVQYVKRIAVMLDYDLVTKSDQVDRWYTRIWIYGKPGERNPIYKRVTVTRKTVREEVMHPRPIGEAANK